MAYVALIGISRESQKRKFFGKNHVIAPGQTLALFLYWLIHKMTFNRVIERPIIAKQDMNAMWPSVLAPVVPRIHVDVSESGYERSWPWLNDTRIFDTPID